MSNLIAPSEWREPIAYNAYWFVEAYAQILGVVVLLFSLPFVRKSIRQHPLGLGIAALAGSIALMYIGRFTWTYSWQPCSQGGPCAPVTEAVFWVVIGWCLYFGNTVRRKIGVLSLAVATIGLLTHVVVELLLFYVLIFCLLTWRVRLKAPVILSAMTSHLAANSYIIYLLHLVPFIVMLHYGVELTDYGVEMGFLQIAIGISFSLLAAVALKRLQNSAKQAVTKTSWLKNVRAGLE